MNNNSNFHKNLQKKQNNVRSKSKSRRSKTVHISTLLRPSTAHLPFVDTILPPASSSTTVASISICPALQGILSAYPQHAKPSYEGSAGFRLRQTLYIHKIELRYQIVGAVANVLLPADYYNSLRLALYRTGPSFGDSSNTYLLGVINGTRIVDVDKLYFDKIHSLPSQAFDSASGYNVPQVINIALDIPVKASMNWYSLTSSGTTTWETEKFDYLIDYVSDSSLAPHPTISWSARWFFEYI